MSAQPLLVLGTANRKKGLELARLFAPVGLELRTLADFTNPLEVAEDGATFAANATLKASQQARHLGQWVLADDSGLEVDALKGEPGVFSARYSGPGATDASNNLKLLQALDQLPGAAGGPVRLSHLSGRSDRHRAGRKRGLLPRPHPFAPQGTGGFGYDPLFEIVEFHQAFGQLSPLVKSVLSHRARAASRLIPRLIELVDRGEWK